MTIIFALQLIVPLVLILWLAIAPASSQLGLWSQIAATALALLSLALAGIWLFPPWWAPWLYGALFLPAAVAALRKRRRAPRWPAAWWRWSSTFIFALLGAYAAFEAAHVLAGRRAPELPHVELAFPLHGGTFLVVNGGNDIRINAHLKTRDIPEPRFARWRGNGYGIDMVALDRYGLRASGLRPEDNRAYRIFGWPVLSPCAGKVVISVDGRPDMAPPQVDSREHLAGNHVLLACGDVHVVLAHFRQGSLRVRAGDSVHTAQQLAEVGNSGISDEAHLHIHAQRPGSAVAPMGGEPLPVSFFGRFLIRGDRLHVDVKGNLQ